MKFKTEADVQGLKGIVSHLDLFLVQRKYLGS